MFGKRALRMFGLYIWQKSPVHMRRKSPALMQKCPLYILYICTRQIEANHSAAFSKRAPISSFCCSVLQCVEMRCNALQCVAMIPNGSRSKSINSHSAKEPCIYPASVAVCCSVLQCVAVCCSVLQCVAVCCSVLH